MIFIKNVHHGSLIIISSQLLQTPVVEKLFFIHNLPNNPE